MEAFAAGAVRPGSAGVTQFLIPVWNDLLSLVLCLPSVLQVADHVVLYDDGSTDGSAGYVEAVIAARPELDITLIRSGEQRGCRAARQALFERADPAMLRVWADADDLIVPERWPRFVEEVRRAGVLWPGFYEVWGDHWHTTHWGFRGDLCHLAQRPGDTSLGGWDVDPYGHTMPRLDTTACTGSFCCFHLNGYKTDERLAFKGNRLRALNRSSVDGLAPRPDDVHTEAVRILLANPEHVPAPMPPELSAYLRDHIPDALRFTLTGNDRLGDAAVTAELVRRRDLGFSG